MSTTVNLEISKKQKRSCVLGVSEGQLASTSSSCGKLHSEVVGGADGEGLTTYPPPPFASPREHSRFMSCPA